MSVFLLNAPQVVFIHIPKTGGSSIRHGAFASEYQGPHHGYVPQEWQELFSFAFVRDPIERFLSAYRDKMLGSKNAGESTDWRFPHHVSLEDFAEIAMDTSMPFGIHDGPVANIRHHTMPMTDEYNCLHHAQFVGRFEHLAEDYARLADYLGISRHLPKFRTTTHHQTQGRLEALSPSLLAKLKDFYAKDYEFIRTELPNRQTIPTEPHRRRPNFSPMQSVPEFRRRKDIDGLQYTSPVYGPLQHLSKSVLGSRSINDRGRLPEGPALIVHLDWRYVGPMMRGWCPLLDEIGRFVKEERNVAVQLWVHDKSSEQLIAERKDEQLHLIIGESLGYYNNLMHSNVSYVPGFWNFDEIGVRNASSGRIKIFDPRAVHPPYATRFLTRLRSNHVANRVSNYTQPDADQLSLRDGALVFFAQYFERPRFNRDYMTADEMIAAAISAKGNRHLYIKPHPLQKEADRQRLQRYHDPEAGVEVVDANVHDLLDCAAVTLSLSSAASFESFLYRTPTILGGQTDFGQNAVTLMRPSGMEAAIAEALERSWPYAQFVTWYLKHHCIDNTTDAAPRALDRIFKKGYAWADVAGNGYF